MQLAIEEISEKIYNTIDTPVLFETKLSSRKFALISYNNVKIYKFNWQSIDITPKFENLYDNVFLLGIDLSFVILDVESNTVYINLELDYFFYDIRVFKEILYVITELEIIEVNTRNFTLERTHQLPNYFSNFIINEDNITIECIDHEIVKFQYN